jgi:hypothetical protein
MRLLRDTCLLATLIALHLVLLTGCGTFEPANVSGRPWDRPTRDEILDAWEQSMDYFTRPTVEKYRRTGDLYP